MSRETIALLGLSLTLIAGIFGFGQRVGALTERVESQRKQIELLGADLRAINASIIAWTVRHERTQ